MKREKLIWLARWALPAVGLWAAFAAVFWQRLDPDFGWHLEAGRYIWQHGVPAHDIFTYTAASFPWIDHEWLSDVLTAGLYALGGFALVAGVFAAVWTAAIMLATRLRQWPVYALGFVAVAADAVARANAWTALFLALLLWMIERRWRWPVVALFAVWANLHGGFAIGLVALAMAVVRDRRYLWVLGASLLATCVNPYGPGLYVEIWRTLTDPNLRSHISEWRPLTVGVLSGFYIVVFLFVVLASKWRYQFALPALLLAASVSSQRQFPLFVVASLGVIAQGYEQAMGMLGVKRGWKVYLLPVMATALALVPVVKIWENPHNDLPDQGVANLRQTPCRGNVFNDYDFGGYVIWQLPGTKVYIDGRMPSWEHPGGSYMKDWTRVLADSEFARSEFERYNVGCALLDKKRARLIKQLVAEGWGVSAKDPTAVLLRRPE
jgi:hypothetical protein